MGFKIFCCSLLVTLFGFYAYSQNENGQRNIWGESGYILKVDRIKNGWEGALPNRNDGDDVTEFNRWLFEQSVYLNLNTRIANRLNVVFDTAVSLSGISNEIFDNTLQQLFISFAPVDWLMLTFGKQRLKWGTAKIFNAIDKLEQVTDPFGNNRLREGVSGLKATLLPSDWFSLTLLAIPDLEVRWSRFATRLDFLIWDFDVGLGAIKYDFEHLQGTTSLAPERLDRVAGFIDLIRYFDNFGIYGEFELRYSRELEYAFRQTAVDSYIFDSYDTLSYPVFRVSAGLHYRMQAFKPYCDIILEYFFNSEGLNNEEAKDLFTDYSTYYSPLPAADNRVPGALTRFGGFRKHYLYLGLLNIEVTNAIQLGLSTAVNLDTLFFNFRPEINFNINNLVFLALQYDFYHQFMDINDYPSLFNFMKNNNTLQIIVKTNF